MNFKTKALFLFGILLFGLGLSYFLGGTFMEGFNTPVAATAAAPIATAAAPIAAPTATAAAPNAAAPNAVAPIAAPIAAPAPAATTQDTPASWEWLRRLGEIADTPSVLPRTLVQSPAYDNYNHYNDPNKLSSTQYYGSTGTPINPLQEYDAEVPQPNSSVRNGVSNGASNGSNDGYGTQYYSTLPPGVSANQILPGDEHLYILKSEIVPPVCPVCPAFPSASAVNNSDTPPPPCPPCGRCPEPSFECKKVPNYNATNSDSMPVPVLNDFSSFGM